MPERRAAGVLNKPKDVRTWRLSDFRNILKSLHIRDETAMHIAAHSQRSHIFMLLLEPGLGYSEKFEMELMLDRSEKAESYTSSRTNCVVRLSLDLLVQDV